MLSEPDCDSPTAGTVHRSRVRLWIVGFRDNVCYRVRIDRCDSCISGVWFVSGRWQSVPRGLVSAPDAIPSAVLVCWTAPVQILRRSE